MAKIVDAMDLEDRMENANWHSALDAFAPLIEWVEDAEKYLSEQEYYDAEIKYLREKLEKAVSALGRYF
jgi:hypothetical protein